MSDWLTKYKNCCKTVDCSKSFVHIQTEIAEFTKQDYESYIKVCNSFTNKSLSLKSRQKGGDVL